MTWHSVAAVGALRNEQAVALKLEDQEIALCFLDGDYYAIGNVCTHQHCLLSDGFVEDGYLECPLHQGRFDIKSGEAVGPPVTEPVKSYPVKIEDGQVYVLVEQ